MSLKYIDTWLFNVSNTNIMKGYSYVTHNTHYFLYR